MSVTVVQKTALGAFGTTTCSAPAFGAATAAGNLLVAVVWGADTSAHISALAENSGAWAKLLAVDNTGASPIGSSGQAVVGIFALQALGSDAAPSFTMTAGGGGTKSCAAAAYELSGADLSNFAGNSYLDTSGVLGAGSATSSMTVTSAAAVAAAGELAIAAFAQERSATAVTWTDTASFTADVAGNGASNVLGTYAGHAVPAAGAAAADSGHFSVSSSALGAGAIAVFKAGQVVKSDADAASAADGFPEVQAGDADAASAADGGEGGIPVARADSDAASALDLGASFGGDYGSAADGGEHVTPAGTVKADADAASGTDGSPLVRVAGPPDAAAVADLATAAWRADSDAVAAADRSPLVQVAGTDAGQAADGAEQVAAALASADGALGADGSPAVRLGAAEGALGAEGQAVTATPAGADLGTAAEGSPALRLAGADAARGADGAEATVQGAHSADAAGAADAELVHATLSDAETAAGADLGLVRVSGADLARAADGAEATADHVADADAGTAAEAAGPVAASAAVPDASAAAEGQASTAHLSGADAGTAAEGPGSAQAAVSGSEGASAAESQGTSAQVLDGELSAAGEASGLTAFLGGADAGLGTDGGESLTARPADADSALAADGGEAGAGNSQKADADYGRAEESGVTPVADTDAAAAADAEAVAARPKDADEGAAFELAGPAGGTWVISSSDKGKAAEGQYWSGPLADADAARADEREAPAWFRSDSDACTAADEEPGPGESVKVEAWAALYSPALGWYKAVAPDSPSRPAPELSEVAAPCRPARAAVHLAAGRAMDVSVTARVSGGR